MENPKTPTPIKGYQMSSVKKPSALAPTYYKVDEKGNQYKNYRSRDG
jgi:hypothetical protein